MENEILKIDQGLFDKDSTSEFETLIHGEQVNENIFNSDFFTKKNDFIDKLLPPDFQLPQISSEETTAKEINTFRVDDIIISRWKNVENISSRVVEYFDDTVILECLIDKDLKIYEEREFGSSLFADYDLETGSLFLLRIFERKNEIRIEVHNDSGLTLEDDFPKLDFVKEFSKSRLFKRS
ncbi:MAG TPA: hypothetical protein ENI76_02885 [Ignavibacteria bacterium]|nr:hypothetical protein [Ignavibacteria bacterium]